MQSSMGSGAMAGLLLVLFCTALSGAVQPETAATLSGTLDQLWTFVDGAVQTVTQSVVAGVDSRLTELQSQCVAQTDRLAGQLETVRAELEAELAAQNGNLTRQLDVVRTELSAQNTELSAQNTELSAQNTELSAQNTELASQLDLVRGELSAIHVQLGKLSLPPPRDCSDLPASTRSGVHLLQPGLILSQSPIPAFCDMDTDGGGWTVFQRRADVKPRQDFFLGWEEYKRGFGELDGEFWWGLEHLWLTTSQLDRRYELRVDMEDFEGERRHAVYQGFKIASEKDNYRLTAVGYAGDAGDSLGGHSGHTFSTKDKDNDSYGSSCAEAYTGAWWYTKCHSSNLNGPYLAGQHDSYANGVNWQAWKGYHYSLKTVTMKIRLIKKA